EPGDVGRLRHLRPDQKDVREAVGTERRRPAKERLPLLGVAKLFDLGRDLLVKLVHLGLPLFGRLASLDLAHSGAPSLVSGETSPGGLVVAPPPRFLPLKAALLLAPRRRPHQPEGRRRRKVLPRSEGACDRAAEVSGGPGPGAVAGGLVRAERGAMIRRTSRQKRAGSPARRTR